MRGTARQASVAARCPDPLALRFLIVGGAIAGRRLDIVPRATACAVDQTGMLTLVPWVLDLRLALT
jgi:hypothetical protein